MQGATSPQNTPETPRRHVIMHPPHASGSSAISLTSAMLELDRIKKAEAVLIKHAALIAARLNKQLTLANTTEICVHAMQVANEFKQFNGADKKQLVIAAMLTLAHRIEPDPDNTTSTRAIIETVLVHTLPNLIDWLIVADRQQLSLNKTILKTANTIKSRCMPCCSSTEGPPGSPVVRPAPEISEELRQRGGNKPVDISENVFGFENTSQLPQVSTNRVIELIEEHH